MKLVHAKLPDRQSLENRALAAIVSPNEQIELGELVGLLAHAFEIAQGQSSDHSCPPFSQDLGALASILLTSHHLEHFHDSRSTAQAGCYRGDSWRRAMHCSQRQRKVSGLCRFQ
jgi:hypothetical protein